MFENKLWLFVSVMDILMMVMMRRKISLVYEVFIKWNSKIWSYYCNGWYECEMGIDNLGVKDVMKNGMVNKNIIRERFIYVGFSVNNNMIMGGILF